jgi:hypothetical protein
MAVPILLKLQRIKWLPQNFDEPDYSGMHSGERCDCRVPPGALKEPECPPTKREFMGKRCEPVLLTNGQAARQDLLLVVCYSLRLGSS